MATPPENVEPTVETPAATGRNVDPRVLALVGGLVVVLLVVAYFLFFSGGGEEEVAAPPAEQVVPAPTTPAPEESEAPDEGGQVETFEVFAPRDPFDPLVSAAGAAAGGGTATEGETGGGTGGEETGGEVTPPEGEQGQGETVGNHRVKVIDAFTENGNDRAQIQVDGTVYTVDEGERFAENFRLVSASGECATMLFGDDEFTLCEGEETLK